MTKVYRIDIEINPQAAYQDHLRVIRRSKIVKETATEWIPGRSLRDKAIWILTKIGWDDKDISGALQTSPGRIRRTKHRIFVTESRPFVAIL